MPLEIQQIISFMEAFIKYSLRSYLKFYQFTTKFIKTIDFIFSFRFVL